MPRLPTSQKLLLTVAIAGVLALPGCKRAGEAIAEKAIEQASGDKVDIKQDGDTVSIKTEQGEMKVATAQDGGSVALRDARDGRLVAEVPPGEDGFLRATLRVMAQARLREGQPREEPFRLTRWDNGTLSLDDVASGRRINLEAFGLGNAAAFARLLEQGRGAS